MLDPTKKSKPLTFFGIPASPAGYAAFIAMVITASSVVILRDMEIPWWAWLGQFLILFLIGYGIVRFNSQPTENGALEITNRKQLLSFAGIAAIILCITALAIMVL